ncbi:MAG TPA: metal-dependent transcriptional regulator, partial [Saprospiraceae bacterium]|nr:metal-dependent transcriptional regulator [Saprospiraceae bacterium]
MHLSIVEENYLKAIYKILEFSTEPVSTNALAERLEIKAATATDMLKRLSEKELINYIKYQGVTLTDLGQQKALYIIRKHRLWEMFLVEKLSFSWDEVHEVAEQLEHINSSKLIDELDRLLEYPTVDPHGDPIPSAEGTIAPPNRTSLSQFEPGSLIKVSGVKDHS